MAHRCGSCNKFVGLEVEVEIDQYEPDEKNVTVHYTAKGKCAECGDEIAEYTGETEASLDHPCDVDDDVDITDVTVAQVTTEKKQGAMWNKIEFLIEATCPTCSEPISYSHQDGFFSMDLESTQ